MGIHSANITWDHDPGTKLEHCGCLHGAYIFMEMHQQFRKKEQVGLIKTI